MTALTGLVCTSNIRSASDISSSSGTCSILNSGRNFWCAGHGLNFYLTCCDIVAHFGQYTIVSLKQLICYSEYSDFISYANYTSCHFKLTNEIEALYLKSNIDP